MVGVKLTSLFETQKWRVNKRAAWVENDNLLLARIARTVKYGEATARAANTIATNIQNLAAIRLLVIASTAENFIA
jgi:hypothetical protein